MTELEKVIKGLEICAGGTNSCTPCPFKDNCKGTSNAAMAAAIKLLKAQEVQGWISVKDRLPEVRHAVLGYAPFYKNIWTVTMREDGCWYFWYPGTSKYEPNWYGPITHWMPLPEKPEEEK